MATKKKVKKKTFRISYTHGGARRGAGRRTDPSTKDKVQLSCFLRKDTIEALREAAGSKFVGEVLQWHLDHYGVPTRLLYLSYTTSKPYKPTLPEPASPAERKRRRKLWAPAIKAAFADEKNGNEDKSRKDRSRKIKT